MSKPHMAHQAHCLQEHAEVDQMLMAHPGIYSKAFAQGSSHAAKWKVVGVRQDRLYIYVSAWWRVLFVLVPAGCACA